MGFVQLDGHAHLHLREGQQRVHLLAVHLLVPHVNLLQSGHAGQQIAQVVEGHGFLALEGDGRILAGDRHAPQIHRPDKVHLRITGQQRPALCNRQRTPPQNDCSRFFLLIQQLCQLRQILKAVPGQIQCSRLRHRRQRQQKKKHGQNRRQRYLSHAMLSLSAAKAHFHMAWVNRISPRLPRAITA